MPLADYIKTAWQNAVTAITDTRLNNLENGLDAVTDSVRTMEITGGTPPVTIDAASIPLMESYLDGVADAGITAASANYPAYLFGTIQVRLTGTVRSAGPAGLVVRAQYSINDGGTWNNLGDAGAAVEIPVASTGFKTTGWINVATGAKQECLVRLVSVNGDGATAATIDSCLLQARNPNQATSGGALATTDHGGLSNILAVDPAGLGTTRNRHVADKDLKDLWDGLANAYDKATADATFSRQPIASITALRALSGSALTGVVYLAGHTTLGDGGQGFWRWSGTSTATDNTGLIVKPDSILTGNPGRWLRIYDKYISVKWFGAKGDSTKPTSSVPVPNDGTDDTAAFQAAIDGQINSERTIYVPNPPIDKCYRLTSTINMYQSTRIEGESVQAGQGPEIVMYIADDQNGFQSYLPDINAYPSRIYLKGLRIRHGSTSTTKVNRGISLERVANGYHLENVMVVGFQDSIYVGSTTAGKVGDRGVMIDVWCIQYLRYGIFGQRLDNDHIWTNLAFDSNNNQVSYPASTAGIYIGGASQETVLSIRGVKHEAYDDSHTIYIDSNQCPVTDITAVTRRLGPTVSPQGDVIYFNVIPNYAVTLRNIACHTQTAASQGRNLLNVVPLGFAIPAPAPFNTQAVPRKIPWYNAGQGYTWTRTVDSDYTIGPWEPETQIFDAALAADRTLTLPGASGVPLGRKYTFVKKQTSTGALIVGSGTPLATIAGASKGSVTVSHDGTNWNLVNVATFA